MKKAILFALNTGCQFAKIGGKFNRLKYKFSDRAEDVTRAVRKARHAAEDFLDETAMVVKKQPLKSAGIAFGVGIGVGAVAGWLGNRR
jgi:ElaB/YqjD/DUF883 family membrane-anchored ribosome-binding protein